VADEPKLRAVAYREDEWWYAQLLEYDLVALAPGLEGLPQAIERLLTIQVRASEEHGVPLFEGHGAAPLRFWLMYQLGQPLADPGRTEMRLYLGPRSVQVLAQDPLTPSSIRGPFTRADYELVSEEARCELIDGWLRPIRPSSSTARSRPPGRQAEPGLPAEITPRSDEGEGSNS
jgi:hypothetical protein